MTEGGFEPGTTDSRAHTHGCREYGNAHSMLFSDLDVTVSQEKSLKGRNVYFLCSKNISIP